MFSTMFTLLFYTDSDPELFTLKNTMYSNCTEFGSEKTVLLLFSSVITRRITKFSKLKLFKSVDYVMN